jgi:hypothetical protein
MSTKKFWQVCAVIAFGLMSLWMLIVQAHAKDAPVPPAVAAQECKGILKNRDGNLFFDIPPEGICQINKSDTSRVLERCTVGQFCRVHGAVEDCKDSGECVEITNVWEVRVASDVQTEANINKCFREIAHWRMSTDAALKTCMRQHKFT